MDQSQPKPPNVPVAEIKGVAVAIDKYCPVSIRGAAELVLAYNKLLELANTLGIDISVFSPEEVPPSFLWRHIVQLGCRLLQDSDQPNQPQIGEDENERLLHGKILGEAIVFWAMHSDDPIVRGTVSSVHTIEGAQKLVSRVDSKKRGSVVSEP